MTQQLLKARQVYKNAGNDIQAALEQIFGTDVLNGDLTKIIKNWDDVLAMKGISQQQFDEEVKDYDERFIATRQIELICEVFNEGQKVDYSNRSQYKYEPIFHWKGSGFGFSFTGTYTISAGTGAGVRRVFLNSNYCSYAAKLFEDIYNMSLS